MKNMKHLKQFNESIEDVLDKDYLDMIFCNFLDRGIESSLRFHNTILGEEYKIQLNYDWVTNLDMMESYADQVKQDTLELKECMDKLRIEYPTAKCVLFMANQNFTFKVYKG